MGEILPKLPVFHPEYGIIWDCVFYTFCVSGFILVFFFLATRGLRSVPGRLQAFAEFLVEALDRLCQETLGPEKGRVYLPFIGTVFLFIWFSNISGLIPGFEEPTKFSQTPIGVMLVVLAVAHISAIIEKGFVHYVLEYTKPHWVMAPLHIVGEVAKGVSLSFRLFGNIFGGAIIVLVVSSLVNFTLLPPFMNLFFVLFIGTVQAFVFSVLSLTYIAVAISEH